MRSLIVDRVLESMAGALPTALAKLWALAFLDQVGRYLLLAGLLALVLHRGRRHLANLRFPRPAPPKGQTMREIGWATTTAAVFASVHVPVLIAVYLGYGDVYWDAERYGIGYLIASNFLLLVLHDAYFYGCHRLLHWGALYRRLHSVHHGFDLPTPWTGLALHPIEAFVHASFLPVALVCMPLHAAVVGHFLVFTTVYAVWSHSGHDLFPRRPRWLRRIFYTVEEHEIHHRLGREHYALYFRFWDWLFGTDATASELRDPLCVLDRSR